MAAKSKLLLILLVSITALSGCLKSIEETTKLSISAVDISADHVSSSYVDFNVTTYVENYGDTASKNTSIMLKAYDRQNELLVKQLRTDIGAIDAGKTVEVVQALDLPRKGSFSIKIILFEGESEKTYRNAIISNLESLPIDLREVGLEIDEMDFLVRNASDKKVVIETDIYFTNVGADNSSEFDVLVKAREMDAQLIADKKWMHLGSIEPEKTVVRSVNLTVPDQHNYLFEVLVWSQDRVVKRGEGVVQLRPVVTLAEGEHLETKPIDTGGFELCAEEAPLAAERMPEGKGAPGFAFPMALAASALIFLLRRRSHE